jgi:hypothetical protein
MRWISAIVLGMALLAIPLNLIAQKELFDPNHSIDVNGWLSLEIRSGRVKQTCEKCRPGVEELIDEFGADVNHSLGCWAGDTPLIEAVTINEYMIFHKTIVESKRRPGRKTLVANGRYTTESGDKIRARKIAVIKALLERGADPNLVTCYYAKGTLMEAVEDGDTEVAEMLLKAGADPTGRVYFPLTKVSESNDMVCFYEQPIDIFSSSQEEYFDHVAKGDKVGDQVCFHDYKRTNPVIENRSCYAQTCYGKRYMASGVSPLEKAREKGDQKMVTLLERFLPASDLPTA